MAAMALIRVRGLKPASDADEDLVINTAQVMYICRADEERRSRVHLTSGADLVVDMPFDDLWILVQRET